MQGIVIQGPLDHISKVIDSYLGIPNVVISTWDDESSELIALIINKGFEVITTKKPTIPGYLNINLQLKSTNAGLCYLKSLGVTEVLKVRSDLNIDNVPKLLEVLKGDQLSFLAICKPDVRPLYYNLIYQHTSFDFPTDLIMYGNVDKLIQCFGFQLEEELHIPPEALITYSYFESNEIPFKLDYQTLKDNGMDFFMNRCLDNNIGIIWEKQGMDLIDYHKNKEHYNY